jgi:predicted metal-binding membrane protein
MSATIRADPCNWLEQLPIHGIVQKKVHEHLVEVQPDAPACVMAMCPDAEIEADLSSGAIPDTLGDLIPGFDSMSTVSKAAQTGRWTTGALLSGIALSWLIVLVAPGGMGVGPVVFVAAWTVMMAAMMLPSAAPLVLLYRRGASTSHTAALVAGYLAVWAAAGVPAWLAQEFIPASLSPLALVTAGIYQFMPIKESCLRKCRTPADFLIQRWGRGAFRIGLEHGAWCLGCCWALMAVLVVVGMMGLAWVIGLTALVALEKVSSRGVLVSRMAGVAFLVAAIIRGIR